MGVFLLLTINKDQEMVGTYIQQSKKNATNALVHALRVGP